MTPRSILRATLAASAVLIALAGPARADVIDETLKKNSTKILAKLRAAGVKNVGVLKFQVEKGTDAPSYFAGRLNTLMATRVENVLILANATAGIEPTIGITRGASEVAAKADADASYDTDKAREKLFANKYPLAWGKDEVTVDAFLTGLVKLSKDYSTTIVSVKVFDPKNLEPRESLSFTVPTSRLLLTDLNQNFFISRGELKKTVDFDEKEPEKVAEKITQIQARLDQIPVENLRDEKPAPAADGESFDKVLDFKIFYDGKEVIRGPDNKVPSPAKGQKVVFKLTSKERVGVVLRVNGVNTSGGETDERDPDQYSMWVLQSDQAYVVPGFFDKNGKLYEFEVLPDLDSKIYPLANENKRGKIEIYLFRQVTLPPKVNLPEIKTSSYRQPTQRLETVKDVAAQLLAMETATGKGLLVPGGEGKAQAIPTVQFNNAVQAGSLTITYFEKKR